MPYAPGVVDRSGELLAAGRMDMARGLAQGIGAVGDAMQEYRQNKMRNAVLEGENEQLIKVLSQDPELKKYVPEADTLDKLIEKKTTGGGLTLKDNMKLNAMLNTGLKVSKHVSDLQQQDMQRKVAMQQLQGLAQEQMRTKQDDEIIKRVLGELGPEADAPTIAKGLLSSGVSEKGVQRITPLLGHLIRQEGKVPEAPKTDELTRDISGGLTETVKREWDPSTKSWKEIGKKTNYPAGYGPPQAAAPANIPEYLRPSGAAPAPAQQPAMSPLPGSAPAKALAEQEKSQKLDAERAKSAKLQVEITLGNIRDAIDLSDKGGGGAIGGTSFGQFMGNAIPGMSGVSKQLAGKLNSIQSSMSLDKIMELKSLSQSGATGFGNMSDKDVAIVRDSIESLSPTDPEEVTKQKLTRIYNILAEKSGYKPLQAAQKEQEAKTPAPAKIPSGWSVN